MLNQASLLPKSFINALPSTSKFKNNHKILKNQKKMLGFGESSFGVNEVEGGKNLGPHILLIGLKAQNPRVLCTKGHRTVTLKCPPCRSDVATPLVVPQPPRCREAKSIKPKLH